MPYQAHWLMMPHPWIVLQRGQFYFGLLDMIDDSSSRISHENNYMKTSPKWNLKLYMYIYIFILLKADFVIVKKSNLGTHLINWWSYFNLSSKLSCSVCFQQCQLLPFYFYREPPSPSKPSRMAANLQQSPQRQQQMPPLLSSPGGW